MARVSCTGRGTCRVPRVTRRGPPALRLDHLLVPCRPARVDSPPKVCLLTPPSPRTYCIPTSLAGSSFQQTQVPTPAHLSTTDGGAIDWLLLVNAPSRTMCISELTVEFMTNRHKFESGARARIETMAVAGVVAGPVAVWRTISTTRAQVSTAAAVASVRSQVWGTLAAAADAD